MKGKKIISLLSIVLICTTFVLGACTGGGGEADPTGSAGSDHEALTIVTYDVNYEEFAKALHEAYPEINLEFISYKGYDSTDYGFTQIKAGDVSDIFMLRIPPDTDLQEEYLIDLSGYDFMSNIQMNLLKDVTVEGSVYLIPTNYSFRGIMYNKTLFEEQGWEVPDSLDALEALIPEIQAAGVTLSECCTEYLGSSFSYLFDTAAPDYITTIEGQQWISSFLAGEETATGNFETALEAYQHWIDIGMLYVGETPGDDDATKERFREGNTAFLMVNGNERFTQNEDGTGDEYGLLPYLSQDGSNNITVTQVSSYYGLSKTLLEDEQKLEDALHVMEFIASDAGQASLATNTNTISPLKSADISEDSPIYELTLMVDEGKSMPLVYAGWENYITSIGTLAQDFLAGEINDGEFLTYMDELQSEIIANDGLEAVAEVEEDLTIEQTARLVGAAFAEETGADCALISLGGFHGHGLENRYGVNGKIYASVKLDYNVICTFNPLGWSNTIKTMSLTGEKIKELAEEGFYNEGDDTPFEYVLVTRDGAELDDTQLYTVACVMESEEYTLTDTGVVGQEALNNYIGRLGVVNSQTIVWQ